MTTDLDRFFPAHRFGDIKTVVGIGMGLSGARVDSVTTSTGEYILRRDPDADRMSWRKGVAMQRLAADRGIAPSLVSVHDEEAATVSVKVSGSMFTAALAQPSIRRIAIDNLVQTLAKLHGIPLSGSADVYTGGPLVALWTSQVSRPGFPIWATALETRLSETGNVLAADPRRVFSHNDVHPANILWDGGRVWLLDWERAGLAHPYIDLAIFSNLTNLSDDDALALLAAQESATLSARDEHVFRETRDFCRILYGAAFLRLVPDLGSAAIASREDTPTLAECYGRMAAGTLSPSTPQGQALIGAALLKHV